MRTRRSVPNSKLFKLRTPLALFFLRIVLNFEFNSLERVFDVRVELHCVVFVEDTSVATLMFFYSIICVCLLIYLFNFNGHLIQFLVDTSCPMFVKSGDNYLKEISMKKNM